MVTLFVPLYDSLSQITSRFFFQAIHVPWKQCSRDVVEVGAGLKLPFDISIFRPYLGIKSFNVIEGCVRA